MKTFIDMFYDNVIVKPSSEAAPRNGEETDASAYALGGSPVSRRASRAGSSRNTSRFDFLGDDEVKEVVDFLDGAALGFLAESGVVTGPLCGLLRRWWRRWRRNSTLSAAFAFLEPGDLGPVVAAYFAEDPPLAHAAHAASCDKLRRLERASRSALVDDLSRSLFI